MWNRQTGFLCGICVVEAAGVIGTAAGSRNVFWAGAAGTAALAAYTASLLLGGRGKKICPECRTVIRKEDRICPECGHRFREGVPEEKLTEYIEGEKEKEMTSEQIDSAFEKIESIALDEVASYNGDIESFLREREQCTKTS